MRYYPLYTRQALRFNLIANTISVENQRHKTTVTGTRVRKSRLYWLMVRKNRYMKSTPS